MKSPPPTRSCVLCDAPIVGRRADARYCNDECRAEAGRIQAVLRGAEYSPYRSLAQLFKATHSRTRNPTQDHSNDANTAVLVGQGGRDDDQ